MKKSIIAFILCIVLVAAWAVFRPELLFIDKSVNESFPATSTAAAGGGGTEPVLLSSGQFRSLAHETRGTASIYRLADGKQVLRLKDFGTSNGPDVQVYLVAAEDAKDSEAVKKAGFLELGALKGNTGDQNYEVPAGADLKKHRAVTIWCRRFGVNFGTAPLSLAEN